MYLQQISLFVENKAGRFAEITELLASKGIDIRALSVADTTDYGIVRLEMGYACAIAVLLFFMMLLLNKAVQKMLGKVGS